jgi:hypothetical protein
MNDFETNWKNSEVISIFANTYLDTVTASDLIPSTEEKIIKSPEANVNTDFMFADDITIRAEFERERIANDLKKIAALASEDGDHQIAFLIENTIDSFY